ncbi:MAG: glycosyltransferase family 1 protein [Anaerolineae bacterium]
MQPFHPAIALNAQLVRLNAGYRSAGIARYIFNLLCALSALVPEYELHAFTGDRQASEALKPIQVHLTRWPTHSPIARIAWEQVLWPLELMRRRFALVHSLAFVSPLMNFDPSIVTVYDLSFILYPDYFRPFNRLYLKWGTQLSVARARRVIVISESTRRDLVRFLNVPPDKIDVIVPGVEPEFFGNGDPNSLQTFRRSKGLPEHFLLYVGTLEPRKNIPALIHAFMRARARRQLPHQLVIAGGRGWKDETITRALEEGGDAIIRPGFVPQDELPYWYQAADAFIYPSQYEGFGMPPLEALAAGTPVITSNLSALPEAVGDAALLVDPHDENAIEEAITRMLTDQDLRADLAMRGVARAKELTWARAAQATGAVYRRVLGNRDTIKTGAN